MSKTLFTADTHFGHSGIIKMCGRPFATVDEMERELVLRWNAVVRPEDEVWHLGDFSHRADERVARRVFGALNGRKRLIVGNHDSAKIQALPWESVDQFREVTVEGQKLFLCHYGMRVWPSHRHGTLHLYGHSHGRLDGWRTCTDVGVDEWAYRPVSLEEIKVRLANQPDVDPEEPDGPQV
jgi:calcineurin-like phosphoesterase family protein